MHLSPDPTRTRIEFADQLRAVAVLSVVMVHFTVVYQRMRPMVAWVIAAPPLTGPVDPVAFWVFPPWLDAGAFGVALFFLISGFVIPMSLARASAPAFLLARFMRIYPTFWAGLAIQAAAVAASAAYWDRPLAFGWPVYLRNALLVNTWFDGINVDLVSWSLNVEIKFYMIMALLRSGIVSARIRPLLCIGAAAVALTYAGTGRLPPQLVEEAKFITYMMAGTLFQFHYRRGLSTGALVAGCGAILVLTAVCWMDSPAAGDWPLKLVNYSYAMLAFGLAYALRGRFRPSPLLNGLAAISYPLYLVHSVLGFTVMTFLIEAWGLPYAQAAIVAFAACVSIAWLLHISIEKASIRLGRRITRSHPGIRQPALS